MTTTRAIVLAGGLGKRMRAADPGARLTLDQQRAADAGLKAMVPVNGRPFLDYILSSLADAGIRHVALVVSPDHDMVRQYYVDTAPPERITIDFAVQDEPLGTAHAVLAAERWTGSDPFLAMNGDNLYPTHALTDLAGLDEPGLPAFDRDDLVRTSNIPAERISAFAVIEVDDTGYLTRIVEKPAERAGRSSDRDCGSAAPELISMNCWRFDARIFDACRAVSRSARGEFELPEAVGDAIRGGMKVKALMARGPVLDLSRRADTADIARRLQGTVPRP